MRRVFLTFVAGLALAACSAGDRDVIVGEHEPVVEPLAEYRPDAETRAAVVATVQNLFDALEAGDEGLLRATVDPAVVMQYSEAREGTTTFGTSTLDGLATRITSSEVPLIERMWDPVVMVDEAMATVWTPYDFYAGPTFSHCGVDAVTLAARPAGWVIVALAWTRLQPPACALHPEGPPTS